MGAQGGGVRGGARAQLHHGAHAFAQNRIGDANHCHIQHIRVGMQRIFHFDAVDVLAAAQQHVLGAIDHEQCAVLIHIAQIAAAQPAIHQRLGGGIGIAPIALEYLRAANPDFAGLAHR